MPVFQLIDELIFPYPELATPEGLLAVGGDLSIERLLLAYSNGIFPWYDKNSPVLWWSPDPRMVLYPDKFKVSKSLKQSIKSGKFTIKFDSDFKDIIKNCSVVSRKEQSETWITREMQDAYFELHKAGFAHSVGIYSDKELVGGLYGVSLGRMFFGESMFYKKSDASKVALYYLVERLIKWEFDLIDVQQNTQHLKRLGAELMPRKKFLEILKISLKSKTILGNWS